MSGKSWGEAKREEENKNDSNIMNTSNDLVKTVSSLLYLLSPLILPMSNELFSALHAWDSCSIYEWYSYNVCCIVLFLD